MEIPITKLRTVELFSGLTPEELQAIVNVGELTTYHQGDGILDKGEKSTEVYVLLSGQVEVVSELSDQATSYVILGAGQSFGEMALLDAGPRSAAIRCVSEEAQILAMKRAMLLAFWKEHCDVGYKMMFNIARDLAFKLRIRNLTQDMKGA
ncbi:MAG: cyclic nucleotide-binding domain-containing protein [Anaerolineae bacterium]|nr:cyclic nucleotide-binding domain-containing protein [Anaerolineae bacterium]